MVTLGLVELQGVHDAVQDAVGDIPDVATLEPGVVLDADASEQGDLLAAQPGHPPVGPVDRQTGLVGGEFGATRGKELTQVVLGGHAFYGTGNPGMWQSLSVPLFTGPVTQSRQGVCWWT